MNHRLIKAIEVAKSQESIIVFDQILFSLSSLIITSIASHSLTPEKFGAYLLVMISATLVWMVVTNMVIIPHISGIVEKSLSKRTLFLGCITVILTTSPIAAMFSLWNKSYISFNESISIIILYATYESLKKLFVLSNRTHFNIFITIFLLTVLYIFLIIDIFIDFESLLIATYALSTVISLVIMLNLKENLLFKLSDYKDIFNKNAFTNTGFSCLAAAGTQANLFLTSYLISNFYLAIIRIGQTLTSVINPLLQMLEIQLPRNWNNKSKILITLFAIYSIIIFFGLVLYFYWDLIIVKLFGDAYLNYKLEVLMVYVVSCFVPISLVQRIYIRKQQLYGALLLGVTVGSVFSLIFNYLLLIYFDEHGAILSLFISQITLIIFIQISFYYFKTKKA
jgi:O-antigen/teichoic acid export membrane protein